MLFDFIDGFWGLNGLLGPWMLCGFFPWGGGGAAGYQIANSLRFRASASAYLSRTPGAAGNQKLMAWRGRIKRGALGSAQVIVSAGTASIDKFYFDSSDRLCLDVLGTTRLVTTQVFRDPSAWYVDVGFILDVANGTAASRAKILINGIEVTAYSTDTRSAIANSNTNWCNTVAHYLGKDNAGNYFDGVIAQAILVDGSTSSTFSSTDINGVQVPAAPSATYGTTGSYLPFSDTSGLTSGSNTGLGKDFSGNGNYWNTNNISLTAGVTYDALVDTPTNNYCCVGGIDQYGSLTVKDGGFGLYNTASAAGDLGWRATVGVSSGKWYWEVTQVATQNSRGICSVAVDTVNTGPYAGGGAIGDGIFATSYCYRQLTGNKANNGSQVAYGASWSTNDVIGVALDLDNGKVFFSKNGTWQASGDPAAGTNYAYSGLSGVFAPSGCVYHDAFDGSAAQQNANFGQQPFVYTAPTGFKKLCTANLPSVAVPNPSTGMAHRYEAGSGVAANIASDRSGWTNWVEIFKRTDTTEDWKFRFSSDITNMWACNTIAAKTAWVAPSAGTYLGLAIRADAAYGCVTGTYGGDNTSNRNVSHTLGLAPTAAIVKDESTGKVYFWHTKMTGGAYWTEISNASPPAQSNTGSPWGTGSWLSSTFMVSNGTENINTTGHTYRYILFSDINGLLKMAGVTGNGAADGAFEYDGLRPQIEINKDLGAATAFYLFSDKIDTYNVTASYLLMNTTAGTAAATGVDLVSNGVKRRSTTIANAANINATLVYARNPFGGSNVAPATAR